MKKLIFGMLCAGADLMSIPISNFNQVSAASVTNRQIFRFVMLAVESDDLIIIFVLLQHEWYEY
jgi:hypothetical protein